MIRETRSLFLTDHQIRAILGEEHPAGAPEFPGLTGMSDHARCLQTSPLAEYLDAIHALCREHGVARLEDFGSICTPDFDTERSDIDFLVAFSPDHDLGPWLRELYAIEDALRDFLGREVDLVLSDALRNRWSREEAAQTRTIVYDAAPFSDVA